MRRVISFVTSLIIVFCFTFSPIHSDGQYYTGKEEQEQNTGKTDEGNVISDAQSEPEEADEIVLGEFDPNDQEDTTSNLEYKTNRFIVKYKDKKGRKDIIDAMLGKLAKIKRVKNHKDKPLDVVFTSKKMKYDDFISELVSKKANNKIDYIQPDFELSLSSDQQSIQNSGGLFRLFGHWSSFYCVSVSAC